MAGGPSLPLRVNSLPSALLGTGLPNEGGGCGPPQAGCRSEEMLDKER